MVSLKTMKPKEMGGRERLALAGCSSGLSSGSSVLATNWSSLPFSSTDVLFSSPAAGLSQYTSLELEASSVFCNSAHTELKFMFRRSITTLPDG